MPNWRDLRRFLENDGWTYVRDAVDSIYTKRLDDGTILRTRVSKGTGEIGKALFARILKQQLKVTKLFIKGDKSSSNKGLIHRSRII